VEVDLSAHRKARLRVAFRRDLWVVCLARVLAQAIQWGFLKVISAACHKDLAIQWGFLRVISAVCHKEHQVVV